MAERRRRHLDERFSLHPLEGEDVLTHLLQSEDHDCGEDESPEGDAGEP